MRFKQRYLLVSLNIEGKQEVTSKDIYHAISGRVVQLLGVWGFGVVKASLQIKYWNPNTHMLIVRVSREFLRPSWLALSTVKEVAGRTCILNVVHCGGTIRVSKKRLLKLQLEKQRVAQMCGK